MEELLLNAKEFLDAGNDNLVKKRFNVAVSDFFKCIVNIIDYMLYKEARILPKSHSSRFSLLEKNFPDIFREIEELFEIYRNSYNLRLGNVDAAKVKKIARGLYDDIKNKK